MIKDSYANLLNSKKNHELYPGVSQNQIDEFEKFNGIVLPEQLKMLYMCFDGGEIFIPGTTIYGIRFAEKQDSLCARNEKYHVNSSIPNNYIVFARLNYGDLICVNLNEPNDVIQWDHESDEVFCYWDDIDSWLMEAIADFEDYMAGEE